jgi:C4-dicarboxylate-specific signal transduction histidine kinase
MLLDRKAPGQDDLRSVIGRILAEAERAAEVVRRLRDFFRAGTTRLETVTVEQLLAVARRLAESAVEGRPYAVQVDAPPAAPPLLIDRLQIEVVLRNLISNAVESLTGAGRQAGKVSIAARLEEDGKLRIVVADDGPGLGAKGREGLFEPFVSGKPTGMGLGLAVSRAIAEAHGGSLVAARTAHGEFHLVLPCATND